MYLLERSLNDKEQCASHFSFLQNCVFYLVIDNILFYQVYRAQRFIIQLALQECFQFVKCRKVKFTL